MSTKSWMLVCVICLSIAVACCFGMLHGTRKINQSLMDWVELHSTCIGENRRLIRYIDERLDKLESADQPDQ